METEFGSCFLCNRKFIKEIKAQYASDPSQGELDPSVEHATSTRRQTLKTADTTGARSGKPVGPCEANNSTGTEKKEGQLGARTRGSQRANPARGAEAGAGEQEQQDRPEVTRGALTRGRARNLGVKL